MGAHARRLTHDFRGDRVLVGIETIRELEEAVQGLAMTKTARQMGPISIFSPKSKYRVQGVLTRPGGWMFEAARRRLAKIAHRRPSAVSDADTVEYLSRGERNTVAYLRHRARMVKRK